MGVLACALAFTAVFGARAAGFRRRASKPADGIVVPILMYHEVKYEKSGKDAITPWEMRSDLTWLGAEGYTAVTMADLIAYADGRGGLPEKPIVLSFDDGYLNNYIFLFPMLKQYDTKVVLSIIGKSADDFTETPSSNVDFAHATWPQLAEMSNSGLVELQNHSYNLHSITTKRYGSLKRPGESVETYEKVLTEDITKLQDEIRAHTGTTPTTFAYPYGRVSKEADPILRKLGFRATLTCNYGVNVITRDPGCLYGLRRICREHGVSAKKALGEAMKTLR